MEGVTKQFRGLTGFEYRALGLILREVNPAAIFAMLWAQYAVEADLDMSEQGPEYQSVMRTLEEACTFVLELIEADWGKDEGENGQSFKMKPHCYRLRSEEHCKLEPFLEQLFHPQSGIEGVILKSAGLYDIFFPFAVNGPSSESEAMIAAAKSRFITAAKETLTDWEAILKPPFDYHTYLRSPEWKLKRDAQCEAAGWRCQVCNSPKQLNCHHRTYDRIGNEIPDDLFVLCADCHQIFHDNGKLARPPFQDEAF